MHRGLTVKRELILGVLYDLSLTIGGEISLEPLLRKTLQKLLSHTGYPCGLVFLKNYNKVYAANEFTLNEAIGDIEAIKGQKGNYTLVPEFLDAKVELLKAGNSLDDLPCKQGVYHDILRLPVGDEGVILLLSPEAAASELPLEQMFAPILGHLIKAVKLCELNDLQKEMLKIQVENRAKKIIEREEQLALLLASTAEGIFGLDTNGVCTFANSSALTMLGYDDENELVGQVIHNILHHTKMNGEAYPVEECPINIAIREGDSIHIEHDLFWRRDGQSIPVEYRSIPIIKDKVAVGQIISFTDISEKLLAQEKKKEAQEKLEHTQRLESLGVLTGGIAHDFNNLLTAILGNTTLAQQKIDPDSDEYELLNQVVAACDSAADLCKQMLAYSGKGKFVIQPVNLTELVRKMAKLLDVSIHKRTIVRYDLKVDMPLIEGDIAQLRQVIMNLITNANEALEENSGSITIATGVVDIDEEYRSHAEISEDLALGEYAYIEVSDTGCGMNAEQKMRIFEPFYTTKTTGRGLGMSAMLGIVQGHSGTLKVYSELGKGTSVKVMFPVSTSEVVKPVQTAPKPLDAKGKTALVIDDEEMLRQVSAAMLSRLGFEVLVAENGQIGLDIYKAHKSDISFVLLDMMMPVMNGEETFQKLRAVNPDVKVLLCSGYNEQEATQRFTGKGLAGFIQKPYRTQSLADAIAQII